MNKSNVKVGILLIILFAVIFLLCYIFGDNDRNNRGYVIFNGYDIFEYKHNEWGKVFNVEIQKMKFKVYNNNTYDGEYDVYLSDELYFFDSNKYL